MAFLLPSTEYDSIREVLGLSSADLADAVIERTPFLPAAEIEVKARVPDYAALIAAAGDDRTRLYAAIVYRTAAALCDRQRNRQREAERLGDYTAGKIDWDGLKATCLAEYEGHVGSISTQVGSTSGISLLTLAGVSRTVKARRDVEDATPSDEADFENI